MTAYRTRPIRIYQHPTDVLSDVMVALNEAARNYGLPMSFGLNCEPVISQDGPPAEPAISLVCHYEGDDFNEPLPDRACNVTEGECESCQ